MMRLLYPLLLVALSGSAFANDQSGISTIVSARPCTPDRIAVSGYLHPTRHGSWISDNPGHGGPGLPIESIESSAAQDQVLRTYLYNAREYKNKTFKAVFIGVTSCNKHGVPVLHLHGVEEIEIAALQDAG